MTKSFDELYAPKAMSLDELFAAIYEPSDNSNFVSASSPSASNIPQAISPDRFWADVHPAVLAGSSVPQTPATATAANAPSAAPNLVVPRSYTDDPTNRRLQTLHPAVRPDFANFLDDVNNQLGIKLRVAQGFRSSAEQAADYAKGRTAPGSVSTGARPGESYHQYGMATDLAQLLPKGAVEFENVPWDEIAKIAAAHGIDWGGRFSPPDRGHFEKSLGHSTQQLRSFPPMVSPTGLVWPTLPEQP